MGLVPKTTKAENKAMFGLSMSKLMGLMMTLMASYLIGQSMVYRTLIIPWCLVCVGLYWWLNTAAPNNPKQKLWQGLIVWMKDRMVPTHYLSIIGYAYKQGKGGVLIVEEQESIGDTETE